MTHLENNVTKDNNKDFNVKKIKRRIVDWMFKYAHDEEIYKIAHMFNIKTD